MLHLIKMASWDGETFSGNDRESEDYYDFAENDTDDEQQGVAGDEEQQQGVPPHRVCKPRSATKWLRQDDSHIN